jgi:large subunit ribosomal protein L30
MPGPSAVAGPPGDTGRILVKQVKSAIGSKPKHRGTLRALGLGRPGKTAILPDRPEIRGMVARVVHLVEVQDAEQVDGPKQIDRKAATK